MKLEKSGSPRRLQRGMLFINAALLAAAAAAVPIPCDAGVIRHDRPDADYRALAAEFPSVGSYSTGSLFGSFTLIAPQWALTAAHVVDVDADGLVSDEVIGNDTLRLGGLTRGVQELIVPTGVNGNRGWTGNINDGFDIALVMLDEPIDTIAPAPLYTSFQELGQTVVSVGYGRTGNGQTGASGSSGTKRAGMNVVDRFENFSNGATALRWDFDEPAPRVSPNASGSTTPLDLEYMIAAGDSGGGSFVFENDLWHLAGVHSGTYDLFDYPGATTNASTYGDGALITRVAAYQHFILSNVPELASTMVPEPPVGAAAAALATGLFRRRRSVRAKGGRA